MISRNEINNISEFISYIGRRSQVIMVYICWASHALQGQKQKVATINIEAKLKKLSKFGL